MQKHRPTHFILALALSLILAVLLIACQSAPAPNPQTQAEPVEAEPVEAEETLRQAQGSEPEAEPVEAEPVEAEETLRQAQGSEPEAEPAETEPEAEPAEAEAEAANRQWVTSAMTIPTADGLEIAATTTLPDAGEPVPAVLLLHMLGSNQEAWLESDLLTQLNDSGYATMTIDMRGHGATGGSNDWQMAETDLQVVWQTLRDMSQVDGQATAVIGASIGANMALRLAANVPQIDTAVLLSPGLDYRGVTTDDALVNFGERPIFYVAAEGDSYANGSVTALYAQTRGRKQVEILDGSAHGTQMLTAEPALVEQIVSWLDEQIVSGDPVTAEELAAITVPQLYATAANDRLGLQRSVERLYEQANEPKTWTTVTGTAHGTEIFATEEGPLLQAAIIDFVAKVMP